MIRSGVKFGSNVHLELFDEEGTLKEERFAHNLIPTVGLAYIADRLSSAPGDTLLSHMAVGTGSTAATASNTTLGAENARVALTSFTDAAAVVTFIATFGAAVGTGGLREAGIFNNAGTNLGTMLCRVVYDIINKGAADTLVITWTVTASDDGV
jgi:hypothetical protein